MSAEINKKVFLHKLHLKCIKMSNIAIINDNNNFALSIFRSLCKIVSDCFGPRYFFGSYAPSEKYLGPKQSPPIAHNDLKKDGAQLLMS